MMTDRPDPGIIDIPTLVKTMRPAFLVLPLVCVLLGLSTVVANGLPLDVMSAVLLFLGALLAHVSVNTLNEYQDFRSGLDFKTAKTPFSGGSGALPDQPHMARYVLRLGQLALLATACIGVYFIMDIGWQILLIGLPGLIIVATYTPQINRSALLCLIAPGLGFGVLMVVGSQFVMTGAVLPQAWIVSLVPFFLVNNLLLLNQYPDIDADAQVGRRHLPIALGVMFSTAVYGVFVVAAMLVIVFAVTVGYVPRLGLLALLPLSLSFYALIGAVRHGKAIGQHPAFLAANVAAVILTPLVLAVVLLMSG
jgi:1,4-dihydroxy-2-naphthoate octaprenyltransferase